MLTCTNSHFEIASRFNEAREIKLSIVAKELCCKSESNFLKKVEEI